MDQSFPSDPEKMNRLRLCERSRFCFGEPKRSNGRSKKGENYWGNYYAKNMKNMNSTKQCSWTVKVNLKQNWKGEEMEEYLRNVVERSHWRFDGTNHAFVMILTEFLWIFLRRWNRRRREERKCLPVCLKRRMRRGNRS